MEVQVTDTIPHGFAPFIDAIYLTANAPNPWRGLGPFVQGAAHWFVPGRLGP